MSDSAIRVLVVDDSVIFRKLVRNLISELPFVEVIGVASNGDIALQLIEQEKPDLITLDIEMPLINGLEVLKKLKDKKSDIAAIMLSSATSQGAKATTEALALGAFDFVLKPNAANAEESSRQIRKNLFPKLEAFYRSRTVSKVLEKVTVSNSKSTENKKTTLASSSSSESANHQKNKVRNIVRAVGIGISTGGPASLVEVLPRIATDIKVPIFIVQHMPPVFTKSLAEDLDKRTSLNVVEPTDGDLVTPGCIYIAPGGYQMKIVIENKKKVIRITDDPPECSCKPSVDYLFRSLSNVYGDETLGIIMTGMGDDGSMGCRLLKRKGATIVAQDEASCVVYGMPRAVIENGLADKVVNLNQISNVINRSVKRAE